MRYCPDCDWMFPSHRLAWSGQCDGKLVWQGKYRTQRNYWCLFHFTVHTVCSTKWDQTLLLGPAWIDHGTLELTHKPGKYLWQPHCRGVCSGGCWGPWYHWSFGDLVNIMDIFWCWILAFSTIVLSSVQLGPLIHSAWSHHCWCWISPFSGDGTQASRPWIFWWGGKVF